MPYRQARGVIHLDSTISGGDYTPQQMVEYLREHNVEVALFTDHDTVRWDYGFFPSKWLTGRITGWLIGKAFGRSGSVQSFGPEAYVELMEELDTAYKDILVIPGVEAIPFFYWEGSLLFNTLTIHDVYKHLLAFGLEDEGYSGLPSIGEGFQRRIGFDTILSLWPVALLFVAYRVLKRPDKISRIGGKGLVVIGVVFLLQNFPYAYGTYDQYHGNQGTAPYQDFIDDVASKGGMVFWAHPEIEVDRVVSKPPLNVRIQTDAYYTDLLYTGNYTGFSAFYEGVKYVIPPGGIWDRVLEQYATGIRQHPVWAIAEGDVEGDHFSPELSQTVFLLEKFTTEDALTALRTGRVYAVAGPFGSDTSLNDFEMRSGDQVAYMGQTLQHTGPVTLKVDVSVKGPMASSVFVVHIIKNGRSFESVDGEGSVLVELTDDNVTPGRLHVYRVDVRVPGQTRLLTNPIFLDRRSEEP